MEKYFFVRECSDTKVEMIPRNFDAVAWVCSIKEPRCKKEEVDRKYLDFLEWSKNTPQDKKIEIFNKWLGEYTTKILS